MSELGEIFKAYKEERKNKKLSNYDCSLRFLEKEKITYKICNAGNGHVLVLDHIDFWLTTGKWIVRKSKQEGRGVLSLVRLIKKNKGLSW